MMLKTKKSKTLDKVAALSRGAIGRGFLETRLFFVALAMFTFIGSFSVLTLCGATATSDGGSGGGNPVVYISGGDLYTIPINGGANIQLNTDSRIGSNVRSFLISPDNKWVVYSAATTAATGVSDLWSVPIGGGASIRLNSAITISGGNVATDFVISPDSTRVIYRADTVTDGVFVLYRNAIGGGTPVKFNGTYVSSITGGADHVTHFAISPDGMRVVFRSNPDGTEYELFSTRIGADAGTTVTRISQDLTSTQNIANDFKISSDSARVVYRANSISGINDLYSAPIAAAVMSVKLSGLTTGMGVSHFAISPDSARVVYRVDATSANIIFELSSAPIAGGASVKLHADLSFGMNVAEDFKISSDSMRVVYRADATTNDVFELYSAPIATAATATSVVKLNGRLATNGDVRSFAISPDALRVVYLADATTDDVFELYSAPIATAATATSVVKLNGSLATDGDVIVFRVSSDSKRVMYIADETTNRVLELYSAPITTASTPVKLNGNLVTDGVVLGFRISPDSMRVVYLADETTDEVFELYSAPIATASASLKLNSIPISGSNLTSVFIIGK